MLRNINLQSITFGAIFSVCTCACRWRWIAISLCVVASLIGTAGTIALESPPTSEPPIFEREHNVQVRRHKQCLCLCMVTAMPCKPLRVIADAAYTCCQFGVSQNALV